MKLSGHPDDSYLLLLKLHGSVDWVHSEKTKTDTPTKEEYASLAERLHARPAYHNALTGNIFRARIPRAGTAWQVIRRCSRVPFIVTMSQGKAAELEPLEGIWKDAYYSISAARQLTIAGYSMPEDDLEIRTLLRAGIKRGDSEPRVVIRNPEIAAHPRARHLLSEKMDSDYREIPQFG